MQTVVTSETQQLDYQLQFSLSEVLSVSPIQVFTKYGLLAGNFESSRLVSLPIVSARCPSGCLS